MNWLWTDPAGRMLLQFAVAFLGCIGFALLFGVPREYYLWCAAVSAAGWLICYGATELGVLSATMAGFVATVFVTLASRVLSVRKKCPVTVFLITGIFPLVPGVGIYWTVYYLIMGNMQEAGNRGFAAFKMVIAIVLGIVLVQELPGRLFVRQGKTK